MGPDDFLNSVQAVNNKPYLQAMRTTIKERCTADTFEIGIQNTVELFYILHKTQGNLYLYTELEKNLLEHTFRVKTLDTSQSPKNALRTFVSEYVDQHPDHFIYVFEDFNILGKSTA